MQRLRVRAVAAPVGRGLAGVEGDKKNRFSGGGQPKKQKHGQRQKADSLREGQQEKQRQGQKQIPFGNDNQKSKSTGTGKSKGKGKSKSKGKRQIRFEKGKIEKPGRSARRECGTGVLQFGTESGAWEDFVFCVCVARLQWGRDGGGNRNIWDDTKL